MGATIKAGDRVIEANSGALDPIRADVLRVSKDGKRVQVQDAWHERAIERIRGAGRPTETCGRCGAEFPAGEACSGPGYHP